MSFFKKLFSSADSPSEQSESAIDSRAFGRYTEVNKTAAQMAYWTKATADFNQKKYLDAFNNLLIYMHDPKVDNVKVMRLENEVEFELKQGSKIIRGKADNNHFTAEAKIARFDSLSVAFLRKLMNMNFVHQYTRYAIKDDVIYLKFDSNTIDASPNKVYFSLKELALKSDKMDDTLINEFDTLHPIDSGHIQELPENIKEVKYKYLIKWINDTLNEINELNEDRMSGGISYMLLSLLFRIDYLLQPQGGLFDDIDKINGIYNAKDNKTTLERNRLMMDELRRMAQKDKNDILKDFYHVNSTFGFVPVTTHKQFYEFILEQFKNTTWYYNNKHEKIVTYIYEWVLGYSLYYYGLYPATYSFIQIAFKVIHPEFMNEMGITPGLYNSATGSFNKSAIEKEISKVVKAHIKNFPKLTFLVQKLKYGNMNEFLYSFLNELTFLNFSK